MERSIVPAALSTVANAASKYATTTGVLEESSETSSEAIELNSATETLPITSAEATASTTTIATTISQQFNVILTQPQTTGVFDDPS